jgi:uncharacterized protein YegP (UPF0339 family)
MQPPTMWILLKQGRLGRWHVRVMAQNGEIQLTSETYYSKSNAERAARLLEEHLGLSIYPAAK